MKGTREKKKRTSEIATVGLETFRFVSRSFWRSRRFFRVEKEKKLNPDDEGLEREGRLGQLKRAPR